MAAPRGFWAPRRIHRFRRVLPAEELERTSPDAEEWRRRGVRWRTDDPQSAVETGGSRATGCAGCGEETEPVRFARCRTLLLAALRRHSESATTDSTDGHGGRSDRSVEPCYPKFCRRQKVTKKTKVLRRDEDYRWRRGPRGGEERVSPRRTRFAARNAAEEEPSWSSAFPGSASAREACPLEGRAPSRPNSTGGGPHLACRRKGIGALHASVFSRRQGGIEACRRGLKHRATFGGGNAGRGHETPGRFATAEGLRLAYFAAKDAGAEPCCAGPPRLTPSPRGSRSGA